MRNWAAWSRFILGREAIPFAWDESGQDCIRFGGGALLALTGADALAGLPTWSSRTGARRILKRHGGLEAAVTSRLEPIAPAHAHRGDIAAIEHPELGHMVMVVEGATLVGPGTTRLMRAPRRRMVLAWSAGA